MKNIKRILISAVVLAIQFFLIACPQRPSPTLETKEKIIDDLMKRRRAMEFIETDVKVRFPEGVFFAPSLEGHAAYKFSETSPMLRIVAFGPMGTQALDLLVRDGEFWVKIAGREKPLCQEDLCQIYGESPLTRTPSILARNPGLFFGGIPEGVSQDWEFKRELEGAWLIAKNGNSYFVNGTPPNIRQAVLKDPDIGELNVDLNTWGETGGAYYPTDVAVKFDKRTLFNLKIRNIKLGPQLPPDVFIMKTASLRPVFK